MTNRELGSFSIKLLGVYSLIQSLPLLRYLGALLAMRTTGDDDVPRLMIIYASQTIPFILVLLLSIILMTCSDSIARILFRKDIELNLGSDGSWREFQSICFSSVAVLIFLQAIPLIFQLLTNLWYMKTQQEMLKSLFSLTLQHGIPAAIQCGLAVVLFFRARGLANIWHRIQIARYKRIDEAEQSDSVTPR